MYSKWYNEKEENMNKNKMLKICNCVNGIVVGIIALLAVALVGVRLFGVDMFVVLSGSMEPTYATGSVIYVVEKDVETLESGVITYKLNGNTVVTHRIAEVTEQNGALAFKTKGDANEIADATLVVAEQIIGTPVFSLPYLGFLSAYLQSGAGRYAMIAVGAAVLLLFMLPEFLAEDKKKEKKSE